MAAAAAAGGGKREGVRSRGDRGGGGGGDGGGGVEGWRGRSKVGRTRRRHCVWAPEPGLGQGCPRGGVGGGKRGRSFPMSPRESSYGDTPISRATPGERHAHGQTSNPRNTQGRHSH